MSTLDAFAAEVRTKINKFEEAYKTQAALDPVMYPMELDSCNEGLWIEFFNIYMQSGTV